ncbi:hypothetical protein ARMGADRAFT_1167602 [Armillaria gallica]|uniref:Uncharacterized protein n=1 Tax=Armillaria gallica TaxID=47427 RepID=A0A2H3DJP1_ARMGA|nr:hypothetical protein ARMGADRAFT_1167602 [Armillaria gallica]
MSHRSCTLKLNEPTVPTDQTAVSMQRTKFSLTRNARRAPNKWRTPSAIISGSRAPDYLNGATTVEISTEYRAQRNGALLQLLEIRGRDRSKACFDVDSIDSLDYKTDTFGPTPSGPWDTLWLKSVLVLCRLHYLLDDVNTAACKQAATLPVPSRTRRHIKILFNVAQSLEYIGNADSNCLRAMWNLCLFKGCLTVRFNSVDATACKYGTVAKAETKAATSEVVKQDNET